jgi:hypothetical protein
MFTQFLYEEEFKVPAQPKREKPVGFAQQVEGFKDSPIKNIKTENLSQHFYNKVDKLKPITHPDWKGNPMQSNPFDHHIDYDEFASDQERNAEVDENIESWEHAWSNFGAAARADLRKAPKKGAPDRESWEKEKEEWLSKWYKHDRNMRVGAGNKVNPNLGSKIDYHKDGGHSLDDPKWFNYSQYGYLSLNDYLRYGVREGDIDELGIEQNINNLIPNIHNTSNYDDLYGLREHPELYEAFLNYHLEQMMDDMLHSRHPSTRYRNLSAADPFEGLQPGQIIKDPGFMSTTYDRDFVEDKDRKGTIMDIYGAPIRRDIDFNDSPHEFDESESIIAPNTPLIYRGRNNESGYHNFDILGHNRNDMNEELQPLKESKKQINKNKSSFQDRMNDFHFEVISPKKYDDFKQQFDLDDEVIHNNYTKFLYEMPDTPPSQPERVDKPVPEKSIEIQQNTQLKKPTESTVTPIPQIIKSDDNFPNSPLRNDKGEMPGADVKMPAQRMRLFDQRRLHQRKHFLADNDRLGHSKNRGVLDDDFDGLEAEGTYFDSWMVGAEESFTDDFQPELDDSFHSMINEGIRDKKREELIAQGMDEDDADDQAIDYFEDLKGAPFTYFARYEGMRNYVDVNNFLRHGIPDDEEHPYGGSLHELGWSNQSYFDTKAEYPYYDDPDGVEYGEMDDDERSDMIEEYENEIAPLRSDAIAALVHNIRMMEQDVYDQPDMPAEMLYRGLHTGDHDSLLDSDPFSELEIGDIIRDPGFMSTSRNRKVAENFAKDGFIKNSKGALMEIFGGGKRKDLGGDSEAEVVFPPLTQLKFIGKGEDGRYMFDQVGYDRNESITESKLQKPQISKLMKELSDAFRQRMNDFQFEVLKQEEPQEEKPEPKKYSDFKQQLDHDD